MSAHLRTGWRETVAADLYRYGAGTSLKAHFGAFLGIPGFRYTFWMRSAYALRQRSVLWRPAYYFCRLVLSRMAVRYGIGIPYNTRIGPGLYIGHYGGIVINAEAIIGQDCNINHGVTVGITYGGKHPGTPSVGDRVFLGPGCKVIGGISVGDDSAIGANAVLVESVPAGAVAVGVPAKVVSTKGSGEYVVNTSSTRGRAG